MIAAPSVPNAARADFRSPAGSNAPADARIASPADPSFVASVSIARASVDPFGHVCVAP
jgi:hypothetical protein